MTRVSTTLVMLSVLVTQAADERPRDEAAAPVGAGLTSMLRQALGQGATPQERGASGEGSSPEAQRIADEQQNAVSVDRAGLLDIRFRNVELVTALEMLSEQTQRNVVVQSGVSGTVSTILRGVTFDEALEAILSSNGLMHVARDNVIYVMPAPKAPAVPESEEEPRVLHVFRLRYISAAEVEKFLKPLMSEKCTLTRSSDPDVGVKPDAQSAGGQSAAGPEVVIVTTTAARLELMKQVVAEIDQKPRQVLIEATIMRATLNEQNALGIDFTTLGGVDLRILGANAPGVTDITSLGPVPQRRLNNTSYTIRSDFNDLMPGGGLTFGIIKDHVAAFIRALEQVTDVAVMANPKVLTLNKQRGEIIVGRRDGYLTTTVTETAAIQTVEFLETGTKLIFRPFISGDEYVRLEIHPEDSNGGLTAANLPFQETTEATTNILVRDGHTILIGGLFRERTQSAKSRVPLVSNIPWIGHLFGIDQDLTTREEVIILLTVTILKDDSVERDAFRELGEDVERVRTGMRHLLMGTGRERLAEAHFHWALDHLRAGKLDRAEADVQQALYINPRHVDAIRLRERLLGERAWHAEGSRMRSFIHELLRSGAGLPPRPVFGRPDVDGLVDGASGAPAAESPTADGSQGAAPQKDEAQTGGQP